jgi:hypothetical protein
METYKIEDKTLYICIWLIATKRFFKVNLHVEFLHWSQNIYHDVVAAKIE